ncbi:MAG: hypothetical protein OXG60_08605 [Chloroflexi bacterium]|nr:hypothetical protein [Chloroflexota bacterium]
MFTRWIYIALVIAVIVPLAAVVANADNADDVICGDLAESDCQILKDNLTAMESVGAMSFSVSMLIDVPEGDAVNDRTAMNMSLDAQGSLAVDPAILAAIVDLEDQIEESPSQLLSQDTITVLDSFIAELTGDVTLDLHLVAEGETIDVEMHLLMRDGIFVLDAGALEDLMGQPMQGVDWFGLDANGIMTLVASDPSMTEALGLMEDMGTDASDIQAVEEAATSVTRLADSEINGVAVAVFESSVDMGLLTDLVVGLYDPQGLMNPAEVAMTREALAETELIMWQYIGIDDHYTYRTALTMEMGSSDAEDDGQGAVDRVLSLSMTLDQSNFNEPVVVEIPEDAFVMPLAMLMQMGN